MNFKIGPHVKVIRLTNIKWLYPLLRHSDSGLGSCELPSTTVYHRPLPSTTVYHPGLVKVLCVYLA